MPRRWVLVALFAVWCLGLGGRNAWTPDEPRELALAASQLQQFTALPTLGGRPFTEKPPLAYWLSGAAMRVLGVSAVAARAPALPYAVLAGAAVYLLGRRAGTAATGMAAALMFATSWLVFNTQIWLASDAPLLAAVSLALLGIYVAFGGEARGPDFLAGCACLHAGLLLALFTKSLAGWLVPVSTLVAWLAMERRLRELLRPAAWLPLVGSLLLLLLWVRSVAANAGGHDSLRELFWDNLVGRFAAYADSRDVVRDLGHPNWPGKYLVELPVYLLPWTPLLVGAVIIGWRVVRTRTATAGAARFALCACLPALLILSVASTARGVYAAPLVPGLALFVAIVLTSPAAESRRTVIRRSSLWAARLLIALDGGLLVAAAAIAVLRSPADLAALGASLAGLACLVFLCVRAIRRFESFEGAVIRLAGAHLVALAAVSLLLFPLFNQSQDLERMAGFIVSASGDRPLILWLPDETTLAMSDLYLRRPVCAILSATEDAAGPSRQLADCLDRYPRAAVVTLGDCPESECGGVLDFIRRPDPMQRRRFEFHDAALSAAGVVFVDGIVRAGGRAYLVGTRLP